MQHESKSHSPFFYLRGGKIGMQQVIMPMQSATRNMRRRDSAKPVANVYAEKDRWFLLPTTCFYKVIHTKLFSVYILRVQYTT